MEKFYEAQGMTMQEQMQSEDMLKVFIYVISQAKISSLLSHIAIIESFLTANIMSS